MRKNWFSVCCLLLLLPGISGAQVTANTLISEVHRFAFNDPFQYFPPGPGGGTVSGMIDMFFPDNGICLVNGTYHNTYFVFDKNWHMVGKLPFVDGLASHRLSTNYLVLASVRAMTSVWVYSRKDFTAALRKLPQASHQFTTSKKNFTLSAGYVSGNMVFGLGDEREPSSLELDSPDKVIYRDPEATAQWLAAHADLFGGYRWEDGAGPLFGPMGSPGFQQYLPLLQHLDLSQGKSYGIQSVDWRNTDFVGTDSKGLIYLYTTLPWRPGQDYPLTSDRAICFIVIDPWQKKALFRNLRTGEHISDAGLPHAVPPNGNIYFFDIDVPGKQFILNRIDNTWWDELGLTHTLSATVNDNRVRIRDKPSTQGQILDYLYENEVTRITDQTPQPDEVSGVRAPWYRITMPDGRQGWVFGQFLNLENQ